MAGSQQFGDFEAFAEKVMEEYQLPGMAVGVAQAGKPVYARGFGYRDREARLPATVDTVFGIGSITKSFTCVGIMQLQEEGRLSVDDPVVKYLPRFRVARGDGAHRHMTIHHFMTHTAGLPPLPTLFSAMAPSMKGDPAVEEMLKDAAFGEFKNVDTLDDLIEFIADLDFELLGPPGSVFSYSNDAYALLGHIIERVSDRSYAEFLDERILGPAGMTRSTLDLDQLARFPEVTTLYAQRSRNTGEGDGGRRDEVFAAPRWWQAPAMLAAGFLRSNVADMLRYMEIYRTGGVVGDARILAPESVRAMTHPHVACAPGMAYGYGLLITPDYQGVTLVEHGGGIKGVAAWVTAVPERDLTAAVLTNLADVPVARLALAAVNACMGVPIERQRVEFTPTQCPAERLPDYEGTYRSGEGAHIKVTAAGGTLRFETEGESHEAYAAGDDLFVVRDREEEMAAQFVRDPQGRVYAVHFGFRLIRRVDEAQVA